MCASAPEDNRYSRLFVLRAFELTVTDGGKAIEQDALDAAGCAVGFTALLANKEARRLEAEDMAAEAAEVETAAA